MPEALIRGVHINFEVIGERGAWIALTPGSRRPYAELKDLMPGYTARFPELPAGSYILGATDGVRAKVIEACAGSRRAVRPLRDYVNGI